jgi:hypothetical protein
MIAFSSAPVYADDGAGDNVEAGDYSDTDEMTLAESQDVAGPVPSGSGVWEDATVYSVGESDGGQPVTGDSTVSTYSPEQVLGVASVIEAWEDLTVGAYYDSPYDTGSDLLDLELENYYGSKAPILETLLAGTAVVEEDTLYIVSDQDPKVWQDALKHFVLPESLSYLVVGVDAYAKVNPAPGANFVATFVDRKILSGWLKKGLIKDVGQIPEPMTLSLLALGAGAILRRKRR